MKTLAKRLRRLEESLAAQTNQQGLTPVEVLRGRIRRRLEEAGEQYVEEPVIDFGPSRLSIAEVLRLRYKDRANAQAAKAGDLK